MYKSFLFILSAVRNKKRELFISLLMVLILLIVASTIMFLLERKAQPEAFKNISSTMWWAVATLTTVGYGDIYPITALGKIMGGIIAILGVGLFALPAGIIASGFVEELDNDKKNKELSLQEEILKEAFKVEYYVPVCAKKKELQMEHVLRKWMSMNDIKYKLGLSEQTVFDIVNFSNHFRLINTKIKDVSQAGLEYLDCNRNYGQFVNRNSNITVVNMYAAIQPFFGHFTKALADKLKANYIVNESYSKLSFKKEKQLDLVHNDVYLSNDFLNSAIAEVKEDVITSLNEKDLCIFVVNAASNNEDLLHFSIGGTLGDDSFDSGTLFKDKPLLNKLFKNATTMAEQYDLKVLQHQKNGKPESNHLAWYIQNKTNCNLLLLHVNVGVLKKKGTAYYKYIEDIANCFIDN